MQRWLQEQIDNEFVAFTGASLSGSIPIKEELLNELLTELLRDLGSASTSDAPRSEGGIDLRRLARFVTQVGVHATEGVVTVTFAVKI